MIDLFTALSILLSILILGCFFLLLIIQINSYNSKKIENLFFIISITAGTIAIISYIFEVILYISTPDPTTRDFIKANLDCSLFFFFTICFYFWYKHYSEIIFLKPRSKGTKFKFLNRFDMYTTWLEPIGLIDALFFIGLFLDIIFYFGYLFKLNVLFDLFWLLVGLDNKDGRNVTFISHVAFLSGFIFFYITYIIINNNLIELRKVTILELFSIVPLGFSNVLLFINDLLYTYGIIDNTLNSFIVNIGLLIVFISLIVLLINYILANPSHIQSPSLYKDLAELIKTIDDPSFLDRLQLEKENEELTPETNKSIDLNVTDFDMPQKLNGTCILILIYLMKNNKLNILAKDLESNLNLNKSTISYNLKILEKFEYIKRSSPLEVKIIDNEINDHDLDQRQKFISINQNGKTFLVQLHGYLNSIF